MSSVRKVDEEHSAWRKPPDKLKDLSYINPDAIISLSEGDNSSLNRSTPSQNNQINQSADKLFANSGRKSNSVRAGVHNNIYSSNLTFASRPHYSDRKSLQIPVWINPHDNGLCWYPCLPEQQENESFAKTQVLCYL